MKLRKLIILPIVLSLLLVGCSSKDNNTTNDLSSNNSELLDADTLEAELTQSRTGDILEIREKMFLTQIEDIFYNFDMYKDKTIMVEGMFTLFYDATGTQSIPGVYRLGPGCCGNDGWGGFLLNYEGELPEDDDWVKVTGTPELVIDGFYQDLYLNVISIEVLDERGAEYVSQ